MTSQNIFRLSGIPKTILSNGLGRYIPQCQRITLKFCKSNGSSRGMREFIENDLIDFAKSNPSVVIYVKPRRHRGPVIVAEYINEERKWIPANKFTREHIIKWLNLLITQSGQPEKALSKTWHTDYPSIQGPWSPFYNRKSEMNVTKFPKEELSVPSNLGESATEKLIEIFKNQKLSDKL